jgi:hypothetical protein
MATLTRPVGRGVLQPVRADVLLVQKLLNQHLPIPYRPLVENGVQDQATLDAIVDFQRRVQRTFMPDGRVDPNGATFKALQASPTTAVKSISGDYSHPDASKVVLEYGANAVKLSPRAEVLLKSIIAACGMTRATLNSTLRTYHDQARITIEQTYKRDPNTVKTWYGAEVFKAVKENLDDVQAMADWWKQYDAKRGAVSSRHLSNRAMDVVPGGDRTKFVKKVEELIKVRGSGVTRIIPKGVMSEPVDHVEFGFDVT